MTNSTDLLENTPISTLEEECIDTVNDLYSWNGTIFSFLQNSSDTCRSVRNCEYRFEYMETDPTDSIYYRVMCCVIFLAVIVGNILVIAFVRYSGRKQGSSELQASTLVKLSLAVADLLAGFLNLLRFMALEITATIWRRREEKMYADFEQICTELNTTTADHAGLEEKFNQLEDSYYFHNVHIDEFNQSTDWLSDLAFSNTTVSLSHLMMMSLMMYKAINSPFKHRLISRGKLICGLILAWMSALIPLFTALNLRVNIVDHEASGGIMMSVSFFIPYTVTVTCSILMCQRFLRDQFRKQQDRVTMRCSQWTKKETLSLKESDLSMIKTPGSIEAKTGSKRRTSKFVKTICMIVFGYSITFVPYYLTLILNRLLSNCLEAEPWLDLLRDISYPLMYINGLVDVLVYTAMDSKFRKYINRLLRVNKRTLFKSQSPL